MPTTVILTTVQGSSQCSFPCPCRLSTGAAGYGNVGAVALRSPLPHRLGSAFVVWLHMYIHTICIYIYVKGSLRSRFATRSGKERVGMLTKLKPEMHEQMDMHMYIYKYKYIYTCIHIYYVYVYMHICICICIYIYIIYICVLVCL